MDNDDNLFDDQIDGDEDLLDISLDDLTTDDLEKPAPEKPDEEVIELIDLVEKSDDDIDEEVIDFDDTKPLTTNKELIEKLKLAAAENKDNDEPEEIGDTASISRSDLELGDITLETGVPNLNEGVEEDETVDTDTDIDLDISESVSDFDETADFMDGGLDKIQDTGDTGDILDDSDPEVIVANEDNDLDESIEELFENDEEILEDTADNLNATIAKPMDPEDTADKIKQDVAIEEKSIDIEDQPVEADTGQLNETVIGPLSDEEKSPAALKGEGDVNGEPVDEAAQLSDINLQEEPPHEEKATESVADSALIVEDDSVAAEKEKSDDTADATPDVSEDAQHRAEPVVVSEEQIEAAVTKVVGEVVEKVAREVFVEVAEKIITEAIDGLKKSLEADSE